MQWVEEQEERTLQFIQAKGFGVHRAEHGPTSQGKSLFVFLIDDPKQNAISLLTPVSNTVFHALSRGTLRFAFHGSFKNHSFQRV